MASKVPTIVRTVLAQHWPLPIYDIKGNFEFDKVELRLDCKGKPWAQDRLLSLVFECPDFLDDSAINHNIIQSLLQVKGMIEKKENPAALAERVAKRLTTGDPVDVETLQRIITEELGC